MSTWSTDAYIVEASTATETLSDPTLTSGRTHRLHNNSNASQVWSSTGATPFVVGGVNVATLTIPAGASIEVVSNGTRWVAASSGGRKFFAATAVSDVAGNAVFNLTAAGFAAPPVVTIGATAVGTNVAEQRITALSATSCTVNCRQIAGINVALVGLTLLGLPSPSAGVTVHIHATEAGGTP